MSQIAIVHNQAESQFEVRLEDKLAFAAYMERSTLVVFTHTEVPEAFEGKGVGSTLAKHGLDYARTTGKTVLPLCPFIAAYIRRHPEYKDLVLPGYRY